MNNRGEEVRFESATVFDNNLRGFLRTLCDRVRTHEFLVCFYFFPTCVTERVDNVDGSLSHIFDTICDGLRQL